MDEKKLGDVFTPASIDLAMKLWRDDTGQGQAAGVTSNYYLDNLLNKGREAREHSIKYSRETKAAKTLVKQQENDATAFKMSILQNPQVLASTEAFLKHAANYNVPMSVVAEFLDKIGTAQKQHAATQAKSA